MAKLYELTSEMKTLFDSIDSYIDENGEISPEYTDKLNAITGDIEDKAVSCALQVEMIKSRINLYNEKIKRFQAEKQALERNAEWLKNYITKQMNFAGIEKIDNPKYDAKITFRKSEKLVIDENADIPLDFMVFKREPNKTALKEAIKSGKEFKGVSVEQCKNIQIK